MKILVIDINNEYGGGQVFVKNVLSKLDGDISYLVKSRILAESLSSAILIKSERYFEIYKEIDSFLLLNNNFDVIILNGGFSLFYPLFSKIRNQKYIFYKHSTYKGVSLKKRFIFFLLMNISYFFASKIICVSNYCKKEELFFRKKMAVIYHGVNDFTIDNNTNKDFTKFLYVGRIVKEKGVDKILEYFFSHRALSLELVGDYKKSNFDISKYLTCSNICFKGIYDDVTPFYKSNGVFLSLPTNEAFGLTIIEAMSYGLIVITSNIGGIPEIIKNGKNGYLIKTENLEEFLDKFVKNPVDFNILNNAVDTIKQNFLLNIEIEKLQSVVNEVNDI